MIYRVGDKVKIKDQEWYDHFKDENGKINYGAWSFTKSMSKFCGKIVTIDSYVPRGDYYDIKEDGKVNYWSDDMFERLDERNGKKYPYKINDRVVLKGRYRGATIVDLKYNSFGNLTYYIKIDNDDKDISVSCPTELLLPYDDEFKKKDEFFNKVKEAEREFYQKDPCRNCGSGNGCDDCRGCKDSKISHQMYLEVKNLKDEYNKIFNTDYNKEEAERLASAAREVRKKQLLEEIWNKYTLQEIIEVGVRMGKCDDTLKF